MGIFANRIGTSTIQLSLYGTGKRLTGEIVLYQPDETIRLEVRMGDETVWLTQVENFVKTDPW